MGYQLETTALISKENYNTFRITRIMLILGNLNEETLAFVNQKTFFNNYSWHSILYFSSIYLNIF